MSARRSRPRRARSAARLSRGLDPQQLRGLLEDTRAVPWQVDPASGQFRYVGPQAAVLLGYPVDHWYERDFWVSHLHPDDRERVVAAAREQAERREDFVLDYRMVAADGRAVWIRDVVHVARRAGETVAIHGFMLDVTELREMESRLPAEHESSEVGDPLPGRSFTADHAPGMPRSDKGHAIAERELERRVEFQRVLTEFSSALIGLAWTDVGPRVDELLGVVGGRFEVDAAAVLARDDAGRRWRIAHRWRAEPADAALSFRLDVDSAPDGPAPVATDAVVVSSLAKLARTAPDEAKRQVARALGQGWQAAVELPLTIEGAVIGVLGVWTAHAERTWTDAAVQELRLLADVLTTALKRQHDRAARASGSHRIAQLRTDLAHASRVGAMGELAGTIAHELNQPLTAIQTNARTIRRLLARAGVSAGELDEVAGDIVEDAVRGGEMLRRMKDWFTRHELRKMPLDINDVLRDVEPFARGDALEHGVTLVIELGSALPPVSGDPIQLQQVFVNLIRNAADVSSDGSVREPRIVARTSLAEAGVVLVAVQDVGPPLSDEAFARLGEPFVTTKPSGLGLGLSITRTIVEAHGGRLWAERNPVRGLTVQFTLPCAEGQR